MLLLIDNYDSFTFNIVSAFLRLGQKVEVIRNTLSFEKLQKYHPDYLVIGPGPGHPQNSGISKLALSFFYKKIPILGICLGHQVIGEFFGGKVVQAKRAVHGKTIQIHHHGDSLFSLLSHKLSMVQYNSLVISQENFPKDLIILAYSQEEEIMAIQHKEYPLFGMQFHPESVGSKKGEVLLSNFLRINQ